MDRVQSVSHKRTDEEVYSNRLGGECYIHGLTSSISLGKIPPEVLLVVDLAINLSYLTETLPLLYFYGMIYIVVRRQNRCQISQLSALIKAKRERKLAFTAFLLLIAAFICSVPILVVMTSASYSPVFRT